MFWRNWRRAKKPAPPTDHQTTTIILHRDDCNEPILHNLQGLWKDQALLGVLDALLGEHGCAALSSTCEILWRDDQVVWGVQMDLVGDIRRS